MTPAATCSKCLAANDRAPYRYCSTCHAAYQRTWTAKHTSKAARGIVDDELERVRAELADALKENP